MRRFALVLTMLIASIGAIALASPVQAAVSQDHDDDAVCKAAAKTMTEGLETFVTDMRKVSTQARSGDLAGAQASVKDAGAAMVGMGEQLRKDAATAETPRLKNLVTKLADEFESLGKSLTDLTSLDKFDTAKLDELTKSVGQICGTTPTPGLSPTPSAPTPSATSTG